MESQKHLKEKKTFISIVAKLLSHAVEFTEHRYI
jgi:hypothetical protein